MVPCDLPRQFGGTGSLSSAMMGICTAWLFTMEGCFGKDVVDGTRRWFSVTIVSSRDGRRGADPLSMMALCILERGFGPRRVYTFMPLMPPPERHCGSTIHRVVWYSNSHMGETGPAAESRFRGILPLPAIR